MRTGEPAPHSFLICQAHDKKVQCTFFSYLSSYRNTTLTPTKDCIREHPKPRYFLRASVSAARRIFLWGEGRRKRFPLQPFVGDKGIREVIGMKTTDNAFPFLP